MTDDELDDGRPRFGFAGAPKGPGYEIWREEYCRTLLNADLIPMADGAINYDITPVLLPRVKLARGAGTPLRFTTMGVDNHFGLFLAPDSPLHVAAGHRETLVETGGIGINDAQIKG